MNFFGHAAAACLVDDDPAFVLGAMAPDLLPMCGAVPCGEPAPRVAAGQAHHRSVDAAFHCGETFVALQAWASRALREVGVGRGGALGAAHVGIELFLDGWLATETRARRAFARTLADTHAARTAFVWADDDASARWQGLILRLRDGAIPDAYRRPDFVAARIVGALARRPRLALDDQAAALLRAFLPRLQARVTAQADGLVGALLRS